MTISLELRQRCVVCQEDTRERFFAWRRAFSGRSAVRSDICQSCLTKQAKEAAEQVKQQLARYYSEKEHQRPEAPARAE